MTEPVAILKSAKHPDAAKLFIDFLLSGKGQQLASDMGYIPASADVARPEGYPERPSIHLLGYDAAKALAEDAANKEKFTEIFDQ